MKKQMILGGFCAAAAVIAFASSEKINFIKNDEVVKSVRVEKIDHIGYTRSGDAWQTLDVYDSNGNIVSVDLMDFDNVTYVAPLPANPVAVQVEPHHYCATLNITSSDPDVRYRINGVPTQELDGIDESERADYLVQKDIEWVKQTAEESGYQLSAFSEDEVFENGTKTRDWFPSDEIEDNTPISLVIYTGHIVGNDIEVTTEPMLVNFTTKELVDMGVEFDLTADFFSNKMTVKADARDDSDIPFYIELYSKDNVAASGLDNLVRGTLSSLEQLVYKFGYTWEDVTFRKHGEQTYTNCRMSDEWVAVAFGCEYGIQTTSLSTKDFIIPEPEITDPCNFEVVATQLSPSEFSIDVQPSSDETRYAAFMIDSENLNVSPEQWIADRIYYINYANKFQWDNTDFIHTGHSTLNTHEDLIEGEYMQMGHEYLVFVCGIDDAGARTTEIKTVTCVPGTQQQDELSFDVSFDGFDGSNQWYHYVNLNITPSNPDAKYVMYYVPDTNAYADLSYTDEEFMQRYVDVQGNYLELFTGTLSKKLSFGSNWDNATGGYKFGNYIIAIFGYDGEITSPLYVYSMDAATGEATQLRGPQPQLSFDVSYDEFDGSNQWYHYVNLNITPSNPDAKYVMYYVPDTNAYADLSYTDEEFMQRYVDVQGKNLELFTGTLSKKLSFGSNWDNASGGYKFGNYIIAIFGYDGEITSPLYVYSMDAATGEATQLRGPQLSSGVMTRQQDSVGN